MFRWLVTTTLTMTGMCERWLRRNVVAFLERQPPMTMPPESIVDAGDTTAHQDTSTSPTHRSWVPRSSSGHNGPGPHDIAPCRKPGCTGTIALIYDITDYCTRHGVVDLGPDSTVLALECQSGHILALKVGADQIEGMDEQDVLDLLARHPEGRA